MKSNSNGIRPFSVLCFIVVLFTPQFGYAQNRPLQNDPLGTFGNMLEGILEGRPPRIDRDNLSPPLHRRQSNQPVRADTSGDTENIWQHNNSLMRVQVAGNQLRIFYHDVDERLRQTIRPGDLLFEGEIYANEIVGKARVFRHGCMPEPYEVRGSTRTLKDGELRLFGASPVRSRTGCGIERMNARSPNANLLFSALGGAPAAQAIFGQASLDGGLAPATPDGAIANRSGGIATTQLEPFDPAKSGIVLSERSIGPEVREVQFEVLRRLISADPSMLDSPEVLARVFSNFDFTPPEMLRSAGYVSLRQRYEQGNEFEKKEALERLKVMLLPLATSEALVITQSRSLGVGRYDVVNGSFPLGDLNRSPEIPSELQFYAGRPTGLEVRFVDWTMPRQLPMSRRDAEALARRLNKSRFIEMAVRFRVDVADIKMTPGEGVGSAEGKIESVAVHFQSDQPRGRTYRLGERLAVLWTPNHSDAASTRVNSAQESWQRLGFVIDNGTVLLSRSPGLAFQRAASLLSLASSNGIGNDLRTRVFLVRSLSTQRETEAFLGGTIRNKVLEEISRDVFRQKDLIRDFDSNQAQRLVAARPIVPVNARLNTRIRVGAYSFTDGAFQLGEGERRAGSGQLKSTFANIFTVQMDINSIPTRLVLDEARARMITQRFAKAGGMSEFFVGVDLTIDAIVESRAGRNSHELSDYGTQSSEGASAVLSAKVQRIALYFDSGMNEKVAELPLDEVRLSAVAPEAPKSPEAVSGRRSVNSEIATHVPLPKTPEPVVVQPDPLPTQPLPPPPLNLEALPAEPSSRFDIMGVRLGMQMDEAVELLRKEQPDGRIRPFHIGMMYNSAAMAPTPCEVARGRARQALEYRQRMQPGLAADALEAVRGQIENENNVPQQCGSAEALALLEHQEMTVELTGGYRDRLRLHGVRLKDGRLIVSVIHRRLDGPNAPALIREAAIQKYGSQHVSVVNGIVWPSDPGATVEFTTRGAQCSLSSISERGFEPSKDYAVCGPSLQVFNNGEVVLLDPGFLARRKMELEAAKKAAEPPKPRIRF